MLMAGWRRDILSGWLTIQLSSMRAAHDFWELIIMSWSSEPFREDRTRKFSIGALPGADNLAKKKSLFGMRSSPNVVGATKQAPIWKRPRSDQVWAIATISKPGWTCMTSKKEEPQEHLVPVRD